MKFSVVIATCMEGLLYPTPFIEDDTFVRVAQSAERNGYTSVWGNDHISTQRYVAEEHALPPRYYDPLITLAYIASQTKRLRLGIGVVVMPFRNPVILAKQMATLDVVSGGRLEVAVGIGAYREEFEAMRPDAKGAHRGDMLEEGIESLLTLFKDRRSSYQGKYFHFKDVESFPKPLQDPFPLYVGGNSKKNILRTARWGRGWLPAVLNPDELRNGVDTLYEEAERWGREDIAFEIAPQYAVSLGKTEEKAIARFRDSHLYNHLITLKKTTLKDQVGDMFSRNLIGKPESVIEKIHKLEDAGMTHCAALLFPANSAQEILDQMDEFAEEVIQKY